MIQALKTKTTGCTIYLCVEIITQCVTYDMYLNFVNNII